MAAYCAEDGNTAVYLANFFLTLIIFPNLNVFLWGEDRRSQGLVVSSFLVIYDSYTVFFQEVGLSLPFSLIYRTWLTFVLS